MKKKQCLKAIIGILLFAVLVFFDQYTKHLANIYLKNKEPVSIIKNVLDLNYLDGGNKGAAWGILSGKISLFVILTVLVCLIIVALLYRAETIINKTKDNAAKLTVLQSSFVVLLAGAVGNLIDRVANGYVVDFIYFKLIDFPIFNVADCYVTVSSVFIIILCLFFMSDKEFSQIFSLKKANEKSDVEQ